MFDILKKHTGYRVFNKMEIFIDNNKLIILTGDEVDFIREDRRWFFGRVELGRYTRCWSNQLLNTSGIIK